MGPVLSAAGDTLTLACCHPNQSSRRVVIGASCRHNLRGLLGWWRWVFPPIRRHRGLFRSRERRHLCPSASRAMG
jgi:hypothetical protein